MFDEPVPEGGWKNPYYTDGERLQQARRDGLLHAMDYPVLDHAAVMPYNVADRVLKKLENKPLLRHLLDKTGIAKFGTSWEEMFDRLGLEDYPMKEGRGAYFVPFKNGERPNVPMGLTVGHNVRDVKVFTYSCGACHVRNLFGKPVIGLNSLKSRAYEYVNYARVMSRMLPKFLVYMQGSMTRSEKRELINIKESLEWVSAPNPHAMSLDTSIAAVSASLDLRAKDSYGSKKKTRDSGKNVKHINKQGFDSKPGTWWLFKYKNRFLSDGSVQGNPIVTNILWNEIGRGANLKGLESWFYNNQDTIKELTTAVLSTEAPRYTDFFPRNVNIKKAMRGEKVFNDFCSRCHGTYVKAWSEVGQIPDTNHEDVIAEMTRTIEVSYHANTPVLDVGTDSTRTEGTKYLASGLNRLSLSQKFGAKTSYTGGYVPQPLVGIWARWPYFHNNSAASLCEVLTPSEERLKKFYILPSENKENDYDKDCLGLPHPDRVSSSRRSKKNLFDTRKRGLSNKGHDEGIFLENGEWMFSMGERSDLLEYLKTL